MKACEEELRALRVAHAQAQSELAQAIQGDAPEASEEQAEALRKAIAERDESVAENATLKQDQERLEAKLSRMREALDSMDDEDPAVLKEAVKTLYEDVNELASAWKNDLGLARDYFEEIEEGFADSEQRDATHGSLRELLESLAAASLDVKDRLKAFRGLLED